MELKSYKEMEVSKFVQLLTELSQSPAIDLEKFDLLLYGGGGQDRKFYRDLRANSDVELLWSGWCASKWSSFLSFLPSQAGLIRVVKQAFLKPLFLELSAHSVSEVYYVPKSHTSLIFLEISHKRYRASVKDLLKNEDPRFTLQAETDDTIEREDGAYYFFDYEFSSALPDELKDLFANAYSRP
ncbi:hypothetical protein D770_04765 [Flammeovirgaceae bacterium 311]|nr:hypothetical protein D770_04765 [Flammeovirgaceae bacterium 311]